MKIANDALQYMFKLMYFYFDRMFADEKTLHRHVVQHSNKEYQCMECDKEYVTAVGLMV